MLVVSLKMASASTLHVAQSPAAANDNPGTLSLPLRSIQAAVDQAQPGDTILIQPGVYRERVRVKIQATKQALLHIQGTALGDVILTGADVLEGDRWKKLGDAGR